MVVVITICFPAGAARVGDWNSSLGLHPSRGSCSAEVVLRPTFQTVLRPPVCGVSTEERERMCWMSGFGELGVFCLL